MFVQIWQISTPREAGPSTEFDHFIRVAAGKNEENEQYLRLETNQGTNTATMSFLSFVVGYYVPLFCAMVKTFVYCV